MLTNYLTVAWRNLRRHTGYSVLNIVGLAVGMACCLLIGLYVQDELSYDRYHTHADRLYRLVTGVEGSAYAEGIAKVTEPWGPAAVEAIPEVEATTRFVFHGTALMQHGDQRFYESSGFFADPNVFETFSFSLRRGDPATALAEPGRIVLTDSLARRYFGDADPLGQTLTIDNTATYTVTGLLAPIPTQSHFTFNFLVSLSTFAHPDRGDWVRLNQFYTYLLLAQDAAPEAVEAKLPAILAAHLPAEQAARYRPFLQPITRIHLHSDLFREMTANADVRTLYLFAAVALFVLLLACINFTNLATARAADRAREVGVRKAVGAHRSALVGQFLGEALLMSFAALVLALVLVELALPGFNRVTGKTLAVGYTHNGLFWAGFLGVGVLTGLLAGSYPAFVLSAYRPVEALTGSLRPTGGAMLRRGLVVVQVAVSAFLIVATAVVYQQLRYIQTQNLGFEDAQMVILPIRTDAQRQQLTAFKQRLEAIPGVVRAAASGNLPGGGDWGIPYVPDGFEDGEAPAMRMLVVDAGFIDAYGIELLAGRAFDPARPIDSTAYILNETAARQLGWQDDALGKTIGMPAVDRPDGPVIGVMQNFHFRSLHETIAPIMLFLPPANWMSYVSVKIQPDGVPETLAALEAVWHTFVPEHPFTYRFLDAQLNQLYAAEERIGRLLTYVAGLALFVACLGLFGLTAFAARRRMKEIGIRKVLGASASSIVLLLSSDFARLTLIAAALAVPLAWVAMDQWLARFAYRIDLGPGVFLLAGMLVLVTALLTVSVQALKAARINPADVLRTE